MKKQNILIAAFLLIAVIATAHYYQIDKLVMIQSEIAQEDADWTAGITGVSVLSTEEKLRMCGAQITPLPADAVIVGRPKTLAVAAAADPPTFDWRNKDGQNWVTPVKSQGDCGSCWAFSVIGALESAIMIHTNSSDMNIDLSEQHLVSSCCSKHLCGDCTNGHLGGSLDYIHRIGVPREECFPYTATNCACTPCTNWTNQAWRIEDSVSVYDTTADYKWALQEYGPLMVVLHIPEDFFYYVSGAYEPVWTSVAFGTPNHAVLLVGWDDSKSCWIIKNCWGTSWGEDGYGLVKYGNLEQYYAYAITIPIIPEIESGINDYTDTLTTDKTTYNPGDKVIMTAWGENVGTEIWNGKVTFSITKPDGSQYTVVETTGVTVAAGGSNGIENDLFTLPSDAMSGTWTAQSIWITDDGIVDAMASIQL